MSSSNAPIRESVRSTVLRVLGPVWNPLRRVLEPVWRPLRRAISYVTSSFFRFLILLGFVFVGAGMALGDGTTAGHLGIYGWSAVLLGVVGRILINWKVKKS